MAPTKSKMKAEEEVPVKKFRRIKWKMPLMPENASTFLYDTGIKLKIRGDYDLAIEAFDQALKLNPNQRLFGKLLLARGECMGQKGYYFGSLFSITKAKKNDGWKSDCLYNEARIMYEMCEYENAMTKFYQGSLQFPNDKRFKAGVHQCRRTIQECIGDQAGPVLVDLMRWIRIVEDDRQRILSGTSYGSSPGAKENMRPISRTIIAAFVASGDISTAPLTGKEGGVVIEEGGDRSSGTVLPDQDIVGILTRGIHKRMTRHYLGRFTNDLRFLEKLVSATSRVDETRPEQDYGFWSAQDPAAALMCPGNRKGSFSMLSKVRDMTALIKSLRESLRCREPYHNLLARDKMYVEREMRQELLRRLKKGEVIEDHKEEGHLIPWAKLEQARKKAWYHLDGMRNALKARDFAKCLSCGERARDVADSLPRQAFALGRRKTLYSGKSAYVRAIAYEIGRAYLMKKVVDKSLSEAENLLKVIELLGQSKKSSSFISNEMISDSKFPFRDPYHLINRIEKWLKIKSNEPKDVIKEITPVDDSEINPCEMYESTGPKVQFLGPSCGGELENAWLFHEMGRCRLETGHLELARKWSRRALAAARRALAQEDARMVKEENEWGGKLDGNKKGAAMWLVNAFILTAKVEAMAGSLENAEAAMMNALDELLKKLPEEKDAEEWIRYMIHGIKWLSRELSLPKSRLKRGSIVHTGSLAQISAATGIPATSLKNFLEPAWSKQKAKEKDGE